MENIKIISDSSSNLFSVKGIDFNSVPLKILVGSREYIDNEELDTGVMIEDLYNTKMKSATACPNLFDWLSAYKGNDRIFAVTISSAVSGSNNSANIAANIYLSENPDAKVFVIDSLSTGPEMALIIDKLAEYIRSGMEYDEICSAITTYKKKTHLLFCLKRMDNLVKNGRVSAAAAKIAGALGIHVIGEAGETGTVDPVKKCRGEKGTIKAIIEHMKKKNFSGGKVKIDHCHNLQAASELKEKILAEFKNTVVEIGCCSGLCSYYAEQGGLMVGFEA